MTLVELFSLMVNKKITSAGMSPTIKDSFFRTKEDENGPLESSPKVSLQHQNSEGLIKRSNSPVILNV